MSDLLTRIKSEESSAKSLMLDSMLSVRSFMKIKKSKGPRTEPWGTPARIFSHPDEMPLRTTLCFRSVR